MRTTVELNDRVYAMLVQKSIELYGSARNMSRVLNDYLERSLMRTAKPARKSMFGTLKVKNLDLSDVKEKEDRIDKW